MTDNDRMEMAQRFFLAVVILGVVLWLLLALADAIEGHPGEAARSLATAALLVAIGKASFALDRLLVAYRDRAIGRILARKDEDGGPTR